MRTILRLFAVLGWLALLALAALAQAPESKPYRPLSSGITVTSIDPWRLELQLGPDTPVIDTVALRSGALVRGHAVADAQVMLTSGGVDVSSAARATIANGLAAEVTKDATYSERWAFHATREDMAGYAASWSVAYANLSAAVAGGVSTAAVAASLEATSNVYGGTCLAQAVASRSTSPAPGRIGVRLGGKGATGGISTPIAVNGRGTSSASSHDEQTGMQVTPRFVISHHVGGSARAESGALTLLDKGACDARGQGRVGSRATLGIAR